MFQCNEVVEIPDRVAQSVTCLATDASLNTDPGVVMEITCPGSIMFNYYVRTESTDLKK